MGVHERVDLVLNLQDVLFPPAGGAGWHWTPPALFTSRLISMLGIWESENRERTVQCNVNLSEQHAPLHPPNRLWRGLRCVHCQFMNQDVYDATALHFLAGAALFDVGEANTCGVRGPGKCQIPHAVYAGNYAPRIQMRSVIASWDNFNDNSTFSQGQIITHTWKNPDWSSLH